MTPHKETLITPNVRSMLLQHNGKRGTYAIELEEAWQQEIDRDPTITGKTLAQFTLQHNLTGLIVPLPATYREPLEAELGLHSPDDNLVAIYQFDTTSYHPDRLQDLGFLDLAAKAITGRHSLLGQKVGIIRPLVVKKEEEGEHYNTVPLITPTGCIINGYEITNNTSLPKATPKHVAFPRTHIASGYIQR